MEPLTAEDPGRVGQYRLCARLGPGSIGMAYLGFSAAGSAVAVKVAGPGLAHDQAFLTGFRGGVLNARLVGGRFVAPVIDAGPDAHPPWLAREFVAGPSLAEAVGEWGPLSGELVLRLGLGVLEALAAVHASGLVHGDLRPSNVLLAVDGPRVADVAIPPARAAAPAGDVFSFGCVLAFAATGASPSGDRAPAGGGVAHARPGPGALPGSLRDLVASCLASDPATRPTIAQLRQAMTARLPPEWDTSGAPFWPEALTGFIRSYQSRLPTATGLPAAGPAVTGVAGARLPGTGLAVTGVTGPGPAIPGRVAGPARPHAPGHPGPRAAPGRPASVPAPARPAPVPAPGRPAPPHVRGRPGSLRVPWRLASLGGALLVLFAAGLITTVIASGGGNVRAGHIVRTLTDPGSGGVTALAFSPNGRIIATGDFNGITYLWNPANGHEIMTLADSTSRAVDAVAFSPDGATLAVGDNNGTTYLWDLATRHLKYALTVPGTSMVSQIWAVAFSPDGATVAAGESDGSAYLWDAATGRLTTTITDPRTSHQGVLDLAFSPGGRLLATGDGNGSAFLWDAATGRRTATFTSPAPYVLGLAFSPDGKELAIGDGNDVAYLRNVATGRVITTVSDPNANGMGPVLFSPDGRQLATAGGNANVFLWDAATGGAKVILTDPQPGKRGVVSLAFSPGGRMLATGDDKGRALLWQAGR